MQTKPTRIRDRISQALRSKDHNVIPVEWDAVEASAAVLTSMIKSDPIIMDRLNEGGLVAISRGGLVPATLLSHMLDVQIAYMIDPNQSAIMPNNRKYVVVDDICDTGKTFEAVRGAMPNVSRVALFCKHAGEEECDAYAMIVPNHVWIHFPWETFA